MLVKYNHARWSATTLVEMATRTYAQYCGLAHALELVGERWALLVIRDLLSGPKRFTDLRRGLPRIPTNVLSARLKGLEENGIVQRRVLPRPESGVVYELTDYGLELKGAVICLIVWGTKTLGEPRPDDTVSANSLVWGLREMFRPEAARGLRATFEVRFHGSVIHARIDDGALDMAEGPAPDPDLTIETDTALRPLLAGEVGAEAVRLTGDAGLLDRFVAAFRLA
jgi:DNA-binding HxlR family transcriptional regulator